MSLLCGILNIIAVLSDDVRFRLYTILHDHRPMQCKYHKIRCLLCDILTIVGV